MVWRSADASAGAADILPLSVLFRDGDEVCRVDSAPSCQCLLPWFDLKIRRRFISVRLTYPVIQQRTSLLAGVLLSTKSW